MDLIQEWNRQRAHEDIKSCELVVNEDYEIVQLSKDNAEAVVDLIRRNLGAFEEVGSVLASSFRRIDHITETYQKAGSVFFVVEAQQNVIGGVGLGPMAGLPAGEGIGEIRELVIDDRYRGKGIGFQLLKHCLQFALRLQYQRLYLETTPQMVVAQKLFKKFGFRAVTHAPAMKKANNLEMEEFPCYFLLENVEDAIKLNEHS